MKFFQVLSLIFYTVVLSACSSIKSYIPDSIIPFAEKTTNVKRLIENNEARTNDDIQNMRSQVSEIKQDVNRLVALEEDIQYFLEVISNTSGMSDRLFAAKSANQATTISDRQFMNTPSVSLPSTGMPSAGMQNSIPRASGAVIELGVARPLPSAPAARDLASNNSVVNDAKFSGSNVSVQNPSTTQVQTLNAQVDNRKFTSQDVSGNASFNPSARNTSALNTDTQSSIIKAIHLVSTSKKDGLTDAWKEILRKYPNVSKDMSPLFEIVRVKDKDYFSLRVGPYSINDANAMCSQIRGNGSYCGVTEYIGQPL